MQDSPARLSPSPLPEFGDQVAHRSESTSPRELYQALFLDLENHVHFIEPAFHFAQAALSQAEPEVAVEVEAGLLVKSLIASARSNAPTLDFSDDFLLHVARQFSPVGLSDGAWLHGSLLSNVIESEVGMRMLKQLMMRFNGPGVGDPYVERYATLLRSLGIAPNLTARDDGLGAARLEGYAYEHALLGLCIGLFPLTFAPETAGFNLWMATVGPCPLLARLAEPLKSRGASLRYFELHDREGMARLASEVVEHLLASLPETEREEGARRVACGFAAAQRSYLRWERSVCGEVLPLEGCYTAPQDLAQLSEFAIARYGDLSPAEVYYAWANVDLHPASRIYARLFVDDLLGKIEQVLAQDPRLNSQDPPRYSEQVVTEIIAEQHDKNVRQRGQPGITVGTTSREDDMKGIQEVFDGCWLQGFVDVQRASFEEYGWLFRIYASEHGDGDFAWNHCQIFRKAFAETLFDEVMRPKTDLALYELFDITASGLVTMAASLNSRRFMPEILGMNMGIESTGVGGNYIDEWHAAEQAGNPWRALAWRLHNSIDNYADGHTKWSLSAVQSFMRRVKDINPGRVQEQWERIWRLWRARDILVHGTPEEQATLEAYFSAAPTCGGHDEEHEVHGASEAPAE